MPKKKKMTEDEKNLTIEDAFDKLVKGLVYGAPETWSMHIDRCKQHVKEIANG